MLNKHFLVLIENKPDTYKIAFYQFSNHLDLQLVDEVLSRFIAKVNAVNPQFQTCLRAVVISPPVAPNEIQALVENSLFLDLPFKNLDFKYYIMEKFEANSLPDQIQYVLERNLSSLETQQHFIKRFGGVWTTLNNVGANSLIASSNASNNHLESDMNEDINEVTEEDIPDISEEY